MRASILKNTNKAVSSSEQSWETIREGTMVRFGDDTHYYTIGSTTRRLIIKNFEMVSPTCLRINGDINIDIVEGDTLKLSLKEYQLLTVISCLDKGQGYKKFDTLTINDGLPVTDTETGQIRSAKLIITEVDSNGGVNQIKLELPGKYTNCPDQDVFPKGGTGKGLKIKCEFSTLDDRLIFDKSILKLEKGAGYSNLFIDSPLPNGVTNGKISVEKWDMIISSNYAGETKLNQRIDLVRDFSPYLKIPFISKGNASPETVYNLAIKTVDAKIRELEDAIARLDKKR